jgi:hypothetical protein
LDGRKGKIVETINPEGANVDWVTRAGAGGHALRLAESAEETDMEDEERVEELEEAVEEVAIEEQTPEPEAEVEEQEQEPESAEDETVEEEEPTPLDANAADALLTESNLPDASRSRLAETEWPDEGALTDAIVAEVAYVTELTGAGRPVGQEALVVEPAEEKNRDELLREKFDQVERDHGVYHGQEEA